MQSVIIKNDLKHVNIKYFVLIYMYDLTIASKKIKINNYKKSKKQ